MQEVQVGATNIIHKYIHSENPTLRTTRLFSKWADLRTQPDSPLWTLAWSRHNRLLSVQIVCCVVDIVKLHKTTIVQDFK